MIKGVMSVDFDNSLAMAYCEVAVKSFESVKDIFEIELVQCVRPDTLLDELKDIPNQDHSSPMELAALHTHYKQIIRMKNGERFFHMEHDAYLRNEENFRMLMSKYEQMPVAQLGMSNEFYTMWPEVAKIYVDMILERPRKGPMGIFHDAGDMFSKQVKFKTNNFYWPANRRKKDLWINKTGLSNNITNAHKHPEKVIESPITQVCDKRFGGTCNDKVKYGKEKHSRYDEHKHPDMHWITLDIDP